MIPDKEYIRELLGRWVKADSNDEEYDVAMDMADYLESLLSE